MIILLNFCRDFRIVSDKLFIRFDGLSSVETLEGRVLHVLSARAKPGLVAAWPSRCLTRTRRHSLAWFEPGELEVSQAAVSLSLFYFDLERNKEER
jgi:hypothetical protein